MYFRSFSNKQYIFTTNKCGKIRLRDSNPRPLEHESSPKTTRPGLLPFCLFVLFVFSHAAGSTRKRKLKQLTCVSKKMLNFAQSSFFAVKKLSQPFKALKHDNCLSLAAVWPDREIIFQYFAIYSNNNLPNCRPNLPKYVHKYAKY